METSVELKKYHIMEYLMNITDLKLLNKVENLIADNQEMSKKEMIKRASIAEEQLANGDFKTHSQAKEQLGKWLK